MKIKIFGAIVALFTFATLSSMVSASDMMIMKPWARASASVTAKSGAAFMMLHNMGGADKLLSASSDVAKKTELHESSMTADGVMKMEKQDYIAIPAGGMVTLKPGSFHVMFMKLKQPLVMGETVSVELTFEKAGKMTIDVPIKKAGAMGMDHSSH